MMQDFVYVLNVLKRAFSPDCMYEFTNGDKIVFRRQRDVAVVHALQHTLLSSFKMHHLEEVAFELNKWLPHLCCGSLTSIVNRKLILVFVVWACEFWCWRDTEKKNSEKTETCQRLCEIVFDLTNMLKHVSEHSYASVMKTDHSSFHAYIVFILKEYNTRSEKSLCSLQGPSFSVLPILRKLLIQRWTEYLTMFGDNVFTKTLADELAQTTLVLTRKTMQNHGHKLHFFFSVDRPTTVNVCLFLHSDTSVQENIELNMTPTIKAIVVVELIGQFVNVVCSGRNACFIASDQKYGIGFKGDPGARLTLHPLNDMPFAFLQPQRSCFIGNKNTYIVDGKLYLQKNENKHSRFVTLDTVYGYQRCAPPYFTHVGIGTSHYIVRTMDGIVWTWGENTYQQLGHDFKKKTEIPYMITLPHSVKLVAAGSFHSVALMDNGFVYSWGDNSKKQLGHMTSKIYKVKGLKRIRFITSGDHHNFAIDEDDVAFGWGDNVFGKIDCFNTGTEFKTIRFPKQIETGVISISAGANHSIMLTSTGHVYTWGDNSHAQLGVSLSIDPEGDRVFWQPLRTETCLNVVAGSQHSMVLTDHGLYYCGTAGSKVYKKFTLSKTKKNIIAIGPAQAMTDTYETIPFNTC